jgi:hypothetical protein
MVPDKSNIITVLDIQASIFNWTFLRRNYWYVDNSMRVLSTFATKCRAEYPASAISTLVPVKSNIITDLDIQAAIFNWTYLRCDWLFIDKSMGVILQICSQIKRVSSCLRYVNHDRGQMRYSYFLLFGHQYSNERISDAIGGLSTNRCVLYFTFAAKDRAQYPVYAIPTMVPV